MNQRLIGGNKEEIAVNYLKNHGYEIIERNFVCKQGEIDIIAKNEEVLCFIEVKFRKNTQYGTALEAVNYKKQQKLYQSAKFYLFNRQKNFYDRYRFDVVAIQGNKIELIKNAFGVM